MDTVDRVDIVDGMEDCMARVGKRGGEPARREKTAGRQSLDRRPGVPILPALRQVRSREVERQ